MIVAGTGLRPNKLGGYTPEVWRRLMRVATHALMQHEPELVISGMAQGWDQALAQAAVNLGIPLKAYVPCVGQETKWTPKAQAFYHRLLNQAVEIVMAPGGSYAAWKMQARNELMVIHSQYLLALWDGSEGGTANCVRYAQMHEFPVHNYWDYWLDT